MKKNQSVDLSIIIGNYNTKAILQKTIRSIIKYNKQILFEIIVVDDASTDGSVEYLKQHFPDVRIFVNKTNLGYSKSYNIGTKNARGPYILHLNSDVLFLKFELKRAIEYMNTHKNIGILGCRILKKDRRLDLPCKRSFPTIWNIFFQSIGLSKLFPKSKLFGRYYLTYLNERSIAQVDCLMGAFMLIRKKVIHKIGYLDEQFFIYGEDIDYCYRAKKAGWNIVYFPAITVKHIHGGTTNNNKLKHVLLFHQAMFLYYKKHFNNNHILVNLLVYGGICIRFFLSAIISLLHF